MKFDKKGDGWGQFSLKAELYGGGWEVECWKRWSVGRSGVLEEVECWKKWSVGRGGIPRRMDVMGVGGLEVRPVREQVRISLR